MGKVKNCRLIKALVIKAELTVQKVGTIEVAAPLGVEVDHRTGELETPVELELIGLPVFTPTIVPCKLINHGLQKACLVVRQRGCAPCQLSVSSSLDLNIPIYGMHDVPHIKSGDHVQELAQVESIDIRGIRDPSSHGCERRDILIVRVVYRVKVIIAREELVSIPERCDRGQERCWIQDVDSRDTILNENNINIIVNPFHSPSKRP
ncbi:MAG TPA: hypothetical protein DDW87_05320 [Firmicutes bacterium]|nr:hypothetical protein [Bacillota bacterium]